MPFKVFQKNRGGGHRRRKTRMLILILEHMGKTDETIKRKRLGKDHIRKITK